MINVSSFIKGITPKLILDIYRHKVDKEKSLFSDKKFLTYVSKKKTGFDFHKKDIETLVLRGSHADYAIKPRSNMNMYNLGLTSTNLYFNYKIYEKNRNDMPKLKNLVLFFSVFTPGLSLNMIKERNRLIAYKYYFDVEYQHPELISPILEKKIFKKCRAITKKKNKLKDELYFGYDKKENFIVNGSAKDRAKTHLRENLRKPDQCQWLEKLINIIEKDKRKLYIVIPPANSEYYNAFADGVDLFLSLRGINSDSVEILDYYKSNLFNDGHFGDFDHMNDRGAAVITDEIFRELYK